MGLALLQSSSVSDWQELLAGHLLTCVESQVRLADVIGEKRWSVDVPGGVISFADGPSWRADLVGSASAEQGTWLWAWADQHLPEGAGAASGRLRRYGEEHAIGLLTLQSLPLGEPPDGIDPHLAGLLATPLLDGDAYFLAVNGPQTVTLVLHGPALRLGPLTGPDLRSTLMSGIGLYGTDHRAAVRSSALQADGARLLADVRVALYASLAVVVLQALRRGTPDQITDRRSSRAVTTKTSDVTLAPATALWCRRAGR